MVTLSNRYLQLFEIIANFLCLIDVVFPSKGCHDTQEYCDFFHVNDWCEEDKYFLKGKCDAKCGWCPSETPTAFGEFTACTKTCDGGIRVKVVKCALNDLKKCPKVYEDCNTDPCPKQHCHGQYRYKSNHRCCKHVPSACGQNALAGRRIIGGTPSSTKQFPWTVRGFHFSAIIKGFTSKPKEFPWMVRLEMRFPKETLFCGGTLIHRQYVLTAAHCLDNIQVKNIYVILGSKSIGELSSDIQSKRVEEFTKHPRYIFPASDIAVIKLKTPAVITDHVKILCLPRGEETLDDEHCFAAGWGVTKAFSDIPSQRLMQVGLRNLPMDVCKVGYRNTVYGMLLDDGMLCAGKVDGGVDTCTGDSGGPLMCQRCSSCTWYIAGVTSFGSVNCGVEKTPGVYTKVLKFEKWIESVIKIPSENETFSCSK